MVIYRIYFAFIGDKQGVLHVWDLTKGHILRSVKNDPIPADGPLFLDLSKPDMFSSSSQEVDNSWASGPITALVSSQNFSLENSQFNWLCSGDSSGCVVVRRCFTANAQLTSSSNIAVRIHAKFRPFSKSSLVYFHDAVTCMNLLDTGSRDNILPEIVLATGDSVGCIRTWLLPQCTQLTQLSASCESSLTDIVVTQPVATQAPGHLEKKGSVQIVGLVRTRTNQAEEDNEHGHVVIVQLSATEENGILNAMYSPRVRRVTKRTCRKDCPV